MDSLGEILAKNPIVIDNVFYNINNLLYRDQVK
jgi:hypothetical protein